MNSSARSGRADPRGLRIAVRVRPGAAHTRVGGRWAATAEGALLVSVQARPVDGAANEAVCRALAAAFGVAASRVRVVSGANARNKSVLIDGDAESLAVRLAELLAADGARRRG